MDYAQRNIWCTVQYSTQTETKLLPMLYLYSVKQAFCGGIL